MLFDMICRPMEKKVKQCYAFEKRSAVHNGQLMFVMVTSNSYSWEKKTVDSANPFMDM
jgi:hypothetical protein